MHAVFNADLIEWFDDVTNHRRYADSIFDQVHLIIGGRTSDRRLLHDVWLYHPGTIGRSTRRSTQTSMNALSSVNGEWMRLPDAPFTPRAFMQHHIILSDDLSFTLLLIGGETGYACNSEQLARCSGEVWQLEVFRGGVNATLGWTATWSSTSPAGKMPFTARCGAALIADGRNIEWGQHRILGVVGGQLSYDDDSNNCAAPIVTANDVWYTMWPFFRWRRGRDAPFSPRRSMAVDDGLISQDDWLRYTGWVNLDKSVSLAGGIRYLDHRYDATQGRAVMSHARRCSRTCGAAHCP